MSGQEIFASDFRRLRAFEAAARLGSLRKAAEELRVTQPAITSALTRLEAGLGVRLLTRAPHGCATTPAGEVFLRRAARFIDRLGGALADAAAGAPSPDTRARLARNVTPAQVRALIAIWTKGRFKSAAQALDVAEPTLHRAARDLERSLRTSLFRKSPTGVGVNTAGAELARRLAIALREIEAGIVELGAVGAPVREEVRIGVLPLSPKRIVADVAEELARVSPRAHAIVIEDDYETLVAQLRSGVIDMMFGALRDPLPFDDITQEPLLDDPYVVACRAGHPLLARCTSTADLAACGWVLPTADIPRRGVIEEAARRWSIMLDGPIETRSLASILAVLETTDRLSVLSRLLVEVDHRASIRVLADLPPDLATRRVGLTVRSDWLPTALQAHALEALRTRAAR